MFHSVSQKRMLQEILYAWWEISWFQTSLLLTTLLLHRMIIACNFKVISLSDHAALALSQITVRYCKFNKSQVYAVCRFGQCGEVIDWLVRRCLPLGLPFAARGACIFYKYHHQSSNAASSTLVWKQKKGEIVSGWESPSWCWRVDNPALHMPDACISKYCDVLQCLYRYWPTPFEQQFLLQGREALD